MKGFLTYLVAAVAGVFASWLALALLVIIMDVLHVVFN